MLPCSANVLVGHCTAHEPGTALESTSLYLAGLI